MPNTPTPPTVDPSLQLELQDDAVTLRLNRPELRNAFNDVMLRDIVRVLEWLHDQPGIRFVTLEGAGSVFCAGADFNWMRSMVDYTYEENLEDANRLARCLQLFDTLPQATLCRVHGAAMGGGMGLVAVSDIVVATEGTRFGFPEVTLGLAPSTIGPYVIRRLGPGRARELFVTGRRFGTDDALHWGFVDHVRPADEVDAFVAEQWRHLRRSGPRAVAACKALVNEIASRPVHDVMAFTAEQIARLRVSEEGQGGLRAVLSKEKPSWQEVRCSDAS